MTPTELSEIRQRAEKATVGPWKATEMSTGICTCPLCDGEGEVEYADINCESWAALAQTYGIGDMVENNANFIAHSVIDIKSLLIYISELSEKIGQLEWKNNIFSNEVKALLQTMPISDEDSHEQSICELCPEGEWSCNECPPVILAKLVGLDGDENEQM